MCTHPLYVKGRYKMRPFSLARKVPCGDCLECRERRANSLYLRARLEHERCIKKGGIGFMCCLTYSDDVVPTLVMNGKVVYVFNKLDVIKFIKRLRTNLDRRYQSTIGKSAPDFKYLITAEYGTDPDKTHRPHYHLLFFFDKFIGIRTFKGAFTDSIIDRKSHKFYFGYVNQCDIIDPKRGGIKYSAKYVVKDVMYEPQRKFILDLIDRENTKIKEEFGILRENTEVNLLFNQCVRSTKAYKKAVEKRVRPLRHMLQFYMCSNDFGVTATLEKYGTTLETMPSVSLGGFPYSLPAIVKEHYERQYGKAALLRLNHVIFCKYFDQACQELIRDNYITNEWAFGLNKFVKHCTINLHGVLRLYDHSKGLDNLVQNLRAFDADGTNSVFFVRMCNEFSIFGDNDLFVLFDKVKKVLQLHQEPFYVAFRGQRALEKLERTKVEEQTKKQNKGLLV